MRGYFDGDGSWFIGSSKITNQLYFSLAGTVPFLEDYRSVLERNCNLLDSKKIRIVRNIGVLEYGGNGVSSKIRDFLYSDATVFLHRKFNMVKDVIIVPRLSITSNQLIEKMRELGTQKEIAKFFGCSRPYISRKISQFNIKTEIENAKQDYCKSHT